MNAAESLAAVAFYAGLVLLIAGAIIRARGAIEKKPARLALPLLGLGAALLIIAVALYTTGPRRMLPF